MNERVELNDNLSVTVETKAVGAEDTKYIFVFENRQNNQLGKVSITCHEPIIDEKTSAALKIASEAYKQNLSAWWKTFKDAESIKQLGKAAFLLPFAISAIHDM